MYILAFFIVGIIIELPIYVIASMIAHFLSPRLLKLRRNVIRIALSVLISAAILIIFTGYSGWEMATYVLAAGSLAGMATVVITAELIRGESGRS